MKLLHHPTFNNILFKAKLLLLPIVYLGSYTLTAQQTINAGGGLNADGSDGLEIIVIDNGQFQVRYKYNGNASNNFQFYEPGTNTESSNLFNGTYLALGNQVTGSAQGADGTTKDAIWGESGQTVTGSGTVNDPIIVTTTLFTATDGTPGTYNAATDALMVLETIYVVPNPYFTQRVTITPPTGNTDFIKYFHSIDTFLAGGDNGPAFSLPQNLANTNDPGGNPSLVAVRKDPGGPNDSFFGYAEAQGSLEFSHWYSSDWEGSQIGGGGVINGSDINNEWNTNPATDNEIAIQIDLGIITTAQTFEYHLAFAGEGTLDLDINDSSGATGRDFNTSYGIGVGSTIAVVDVDEEIQNIVGDVQEVRITLTNPLSGDALTVATGSLPAGVQVQSQTTSQIILEAISTPQTEATFDSALQSAIGFTTTSNDLTDRIIEFGMTNEIGLEGGTALTTIDMFIPDTDGDGVPDSSDICNGFDDNADNDTDGVPDGCDEDDDNDGILDIDECSLPSTITGITPDGIEDGNFGYGYWDAEYYEGHFAITGSTFGNSDQDSQLDGSPGTPIFRGEAFFGFNSLSFSDSRTYGQTGPFDTNTSTGLVPANYVGVNVDNVAFQPYYQTIFKRIADVDGTLSFGGPGFSVDDVLEIFVDGTRVVFTAFCCGATSVPTTPQSIPVLAGQNIEMRYTNLGFIGSYNFNFVLTPSCDSDADGDVIPNAFDLDSDNDGCFDALEGDENVTAAQLTGTGAIDIAANGGVDANGVPNLVNSGGAADAGSDQGQGATGNEIVATQITVSTAPADDSVNSGDPASFTVTATAINTTTWNTGTPDYTIPPATDVSANLQYQWQENGADLSDTGVYSGTNTATLNISDATGLDGNVYNVVITHLNLECDEQSSATLSVNPIIDAVDDSFTTSEGNNTAAVTNNDTLDGNPVVIGTSPGEVTVTDDPNGTNPAGFTVNADGTISVAAGTPSGTYTVEYQICENGASPANCDIASVSVTVDNTIDAVADSVTTTEDGTTTDVTDNDTLNGDPVVIGTSPGEVTVTDDPNGTNPAGFTVNADGTISVAAGTPSGTYTVEYQICENGASPANCDIASVSVTVDNTIDAVADSVTTTEDGTTTDVTDNDTLNGDPVVIGTSPGEVTVTDDPNGTNPAGFTVNADGTISVAAGTPSGTYTVEYQICENGASPANCDIASVSVTVDNTIDAVADSVTTTEDGTTTDVTDNDTLNGDPVVIGTSPGEVTVTDDPNGTNPAGFTVNADGTISVAAGTPSGTYTVEYQICENGASPANCDIASVSVTVDNTIDAVADSVTTTEDGTTTDVTDNDTLNGDPVVIGTSPGEVTVTDDPNGTNPAGFTVNADGTISVAAGTPSGTYTVEYQICENGASPANCDIASVSVTVDNTIDAVADSVTTTEDGTTTDVTDNDTLNGDPVVIGTSPGEVTVTDDPNGTNPAGFTVNADGTISVAAGTPSGTYTVEYQICENGASPANCDIASVSVTVDNTIDAVADSVTTTEDGTTTDVTDNDTLNGDPVVIGTSPGEVTVTDDPNGTNPAGFTVNADGTISVAAGTPSGTYTVEYQICENGASPANCDIASVSVTVDNTIDAVADSVTTTEDGTTTDVTDNDTLNGDPVVIGTSPGEVTVTDDPNGTNPAGFTVNADGTISVAAGTPSGTYTVEYQICENGASPANCDIASVSVTVDNTIDAVADSVTTTEDGTTTDVTDNDTLNGDPVVIGTSPGEVTVTDDPNGTNPAGFTVNADGTISVAAGTPSGTYTVEYQICENGASPANCDIASVSVTVDNTIDAVADSVTTTEDGTTTDVTDNDTLNGDPVVIGTSPGEVTVTDDPNGTNPAGFTVNADGTISVAAGTPSGTYTVEYQICENGASPANCDIASVSVTVDNTIDAVADSVTTTEDGTTTDVTDNDTLNGDPVVIGTSPGEVTVTDDPNGTNPAGFTVNADGTISVAAGTPSGTYTVEYQICENGASPANCDIASVSVTVDNTIDAVADSVTTTEDGTTTDVTDNDTLNGDPVVIGTSPGEVTVTDDPNGTNPAGFTVNADGTISVAAGTPSGTYTVEYQICENGASPANCDIASVSVTVDNTIDAVADSVTTTEDGTTTDVTDNDTLNGDPVVIGTSPGEVTVTDDPNGTNPAGFTVNADGTISVAAGTPSGTYTVEYQICENGASPANCDIASVSVTVDNTIDAVADSVTTTEDGTTTDVTDNDTLNGDPVVIGTSPGEVTVTDDPNGTNPAGFTVNADGTISVAAGTPSGTYTVEYQICENGASPANCDIASVSVTVDNTIDAVADSVTTTEDGTTTDVTDNDTLNGDPVVIGTSPGEVTVTDDPNGTNPAGFTVNADGTISVAAGTPSGTYTVEYQICENGASPANCDIASVSVTVDNTIDAVADSVTTTEDGTTTDVTDNDTLNGDPVVIGTSPGEVTVTDDPNGTNPAGFTVNADGTISVAAGTPSGTYTVEYQICENGASPANCDIASVSVTVDNTIDAVADSVTTTEDGTTTDVTDNDTLNGDPVVIGTSPGEVTVTDDPNGTNPAGFTVNADGTISVAAGTPSGTYTVEYQICENGASPANCDIASVSVTVDNTIDAVADSVTTTEDGTTTDVTDNDTLNGDPVVIGTSPGEVTVTDDPNGTNPAGFTVNADGTISVAAGTPSGTYTVEYQLCENGAVPVNCDIATVTIEIDGDTDGDGISDGQEALDGTDPNDDCDSIGGTPLGTSDCDNDGLTNDEETTGIDDPSTTANPNGITTNPDIADTDGDGINDGQEALDNTDPNNSCDSIGGIPQGTDDCDGDGLTNDEELTGIDDPSTPANPNGNTTSPADPDTDGDGINDGQEALDGTDPNDDCDSIGGTPLGTSDCDNDGLTNDEETTGIDDPSTPADPNGNITDTSDPDTDGDGNNDGQDPNPTTPLATDDSGSGEPGETIIVNILANDDYLNNSDPNNLGTTTITNTGTGTATGTVSIDADTGQLTYIPNGSEAGTTVTIEYEVCNDESGAPICTTAVVTIDVGTTDSDGDGITDDQELIDGTDPNDDCDSIGGTPLGVSDCDADGLTTDEENSLGTDPNNPDSDGDGILDGQEVLDNTNPLDDCESIGGTPLGLSDCDGDGLTNDEELTGTDDPSTPANPNGNTTNPDIADTDGDTINDGQEALDGTDPNDGCNSLGGTPPAGLDCDIEIVSDYLVPNSVDDTVFRIRNIERFPNNTVRIYNRWGVLVFETNAYDNVSRVFTGISTGRATVSVEDELPAGVYYYVINYEDNGTMKSMNGYLYINR